MPNTPRPFRPCGLAITDALNAGRIAGANGPRSLLCGRLITDGRATFNAAVSRDERRTFEAPSRVN
jgi:hypothetical protein